TPPPTTTAPWPPPPVWLPARRRLSSRRMPISAIRIVRFRSGVGSCASSSLTARASRSWTGFAVKFLGSMLGLRGVKRAMSHAFWRKCDFQIHTPRDPNWVGSRPLGAGDIIKETGAEATADDVDAARMQWASEFVDQCIAKGLQAVAITDHHEMVMVPYVQQVIADRKKADLAFDLWLFPGMELTANSGKQCLIIFDAALSEDWRRQAQGKLGIIYADLDEKAAKSPKVTQL